MRLATGLRSDVSWLGEREVVKPIAPARTASAAMSAMRPTSSALASSMNARGPIT